MKSALISTLEVRESGFRVAEVVEQGQKFEVNTTLFWHDCEDYVEADKYWYNPENESFNLFPEPPIE